MANNTKNVFWVLLNFDQPFHRFTAAPTSPKSLRLIGGNPLGMKAFYFQTGLRQPEFNILPPLSDQFTSLRMHSECLTGAGTAAFDKGTPGVASDPPLWLLQCPWPDRPARAPLGPTAQARRHRREDKEKEEEGGRHPFTGSPACGGPGGRPTARGGGPGAAGLGEETAGENGDHW